ncbi:hypothetical protein IWW50_004389, partial [Coemansia erecta]
VKARQQVFFAMRRQNAGVTQDTKRVRQAELLADQIECRSRIKRIRGSFDIFALEGKEEYIGLETWPDAGNTGSRGGQWGVQGCATTDGSEISPVLATYDGRSRLQLEDVLE